MLEISTVDDDTDDTHLCIKCNATIIGLDNYVKHRKTVCSKSVAQQSTSSSKVQLLTDNAEDNDSFLGADLFMSTLQLQRSTKKLEIPNNKNRVLTRQATAAILANTNPRSTDCPSSNGSENWIGGHELKVSVSGNEDNHTKLIKAVANISGTSKKDDFKTPYSILDNYKCVDDYKDSSESSEDDLEDHEYENPPRGYTGGKWKPRSPWTQRMPEWELSDEHTGGKWKPPESQKLNKSNENISDDEDMAKRNDDKMSKSMFFDEIGLKVPKETDNFYDDELMNAEHATGKWPPSDHTKGKWPPADHTKGKWPPSDHTKDKCPPPDYTKGKWSPSEHSKDKYISYEHTKGKWPPIDNCREKCPPPEYTKGKWPPSEHTKGKWPPPEHTKGKWSQSEISKDKNPSAENNKGKWPPPEHTKGKWPPPEHTKGKWPPPEHTKGKWPPPECTKSKWPHSEHIKGKLPPLEHTKEICPHPENPKEKWPPSEHTRGKWLPGETSTSKSSKTSKLPSHEYWCGPCNRKLSSKVLYDRHLTSNLHLKRTSFENELEFDPVWTRKRTVKPSIFLNDNVYAKATKRRNKNRKGQVVKTRNRQPLYMKCNVCNSKFSPHLVGKHLISHFHCRKTNLTDEDSKNMILNNIHSIVKQAPYQCQICKFYANTEIAFMQHWNSEYHIENTTKLLGDYWCSFCKFETKELYSMTKHLKSETHQEVISVVNRSVPILIRNKSIIKCGICHKQFRYNIELKRHGETNCKMEENTASSSYQNKHTCPECSSVFKSKVSFQRHSIKEHKKELYFCSACNMNFENSKMAKEHRRLQHHKLMALQARVRKGHSVKNLSKKCPHCDAVLSDILALKSHLKEEHSDKKFSCPKCGMEFLLPQEVTSHVKKNDCSLQNSEENKWKCKICPYSTQSQAECVFHEILHGDPSIIEVDEENTRYVPKYKCPICSKLFRKASLRCHLRQHSDERPFACDKCPMKFTRKGNLTDHSRNIHSERIHKESSEKESTTEDQNRPFLCQMCDARFAKKYTLQQHFHTHRTSDPVLSAACTSDTDADAYLTLAHAYRCEVPLCRHVARSAGELREHAATHGTTRQHSCLNCEYSAKTRAQLLRHIKLHEDVSKSFKCTDCSYAGRTRAHLRKHSQRHLGSAEELRYRCPHCDFRCQSLENLRKHVLSTSKHPGKEMYNCSLCPTLQRYASNTAKDFKNHLMETHSSHFGSDKKAVQYIAAFLYAPGNRISKYERIDITVDTDFHINTRNEMKPFEMSNILENIVQSPRSSETSTVWVATPVQDGDIKVDHNEFNFSDNNMDYEGIYNVDPKGILIPYND